MTREPTKTSPDSVEAELKALRHQLEKLNNQRYMKVQNSWHKLFGYFFVRGLATGLGTVVGATLLVSVLLYLLAQIDFIPILGEWAGRIAEQIQGR